MQYAAPSPRDARTDHRSRATRQTSPVTRALTAAALLVAAACSTSAGPADGSAAEAASAIDSIAAAHGLARWSDVERLDFTFAVDVADTTRVRRAWTWYPRADSVTLATDGRTVAYVRSEPLDSVGRAADAEFVNDTYWLLMPFYLVWSEDGYERAVTYRDTMPLSGALGTKVTVQYRAEGGYTPGDAYDLYVDDGYRLREWVYRRGGQPAPSMVMDWGGYEDLGGLVLPTDHRGEGPVRISHPGTRVTFR